jgi:ubiquinone/menaquinone biosynthesis C-methylase UbiE
MNSLPFDSIAQDYDQTFTHTLVGQLQRQRVYWHLTHLLAQHKIKEVLEFNCGTGEDALWLAKKNCHVLATDNASEMINVAGKKIDNQHPSLSQNIDFQTLSLENLNQLPQNKAFDLVFSNFGGLNCIAPDTFQKWANSIAKYVQPKGYLCLVILGRFCAWESLYFLLKGNWTAAWRRQKKGFVEAQLDQNTKVPIWYYSPKTVAHYLKNDFKTIKIQPIGFALPPSYLNPFFQPKPQLLDFLNRIEKRLGHQTIWTNFADHYLILLQKVDS